MKLITQGNITSLELLEQINFFRNQDGIKNQLLHKNLLSVIRDEFEEEISQLKIQPSKYVNSRGREYVMYNLTLSQAKQVLIRESKQVRRAVIKYIEELESKSFRGMCFNNRPVISLSMLSNILGVEKMTVHRALQRLGLHTVVTGKELQRYRKETGVTYNPTSILVIYDYIAIKVAEYLGKSTDKLLEYFGVVSSDITLDEVFDIEKEIILSSGRDIKRLALELCQKVKLRFI